MQAQHCSKREQKFASMALMRSYSRLAGLSLVARELEFFTQQSAVPASGTFAMHGTGPHEAHAPGALS